ncbi:maleylacetoacetate isomerase [Polynucleobacter sp. MWH-UH2A]|uniref:maleylacetoacetate isomerase n=1 Tax=Polynucleobacter sp. MWH-UH2A TaxID=1855617 RepID=UPI001BFD6EDE|nr:maleylacetoacetate isomerase [Polynucleobacter sp. MWH-UH2A]QWD63870.1 maleylacetoacetate isomerase [Polynucleobacter sp. MWH-UH2A]
MTTTSNSKPRLYSFWRSSAAFRVRIALNLKGIPCDITPVHITKSGGAQFDLDYSEKNPTHLVPLFEDGKVSIHQSLAIIEYLEETHPNPRLLPTSPEDRAWVRSLAMDIACDIHPINNLRVLRYLVKNVGSTNETKDTWYQHWIKLGLNSLEKQLSTDSRVRRFAYGDQPGLVEACLVPQLFNALSSGMDLTPYPSLVKILHECLKLPAFMDASWEKQIDAEGLNPSIPPQK